MIGRWKRRQSQLNQASKTGSTLCAPWCLEKSDSRWHERQAGSSKISTKWIPMRSLPRLPPCNQQVIPQRLHLTAPLSLLTIIHCTLLTVIADNYLLQVSPAVISVPPPNPRLTVKHLSLDGHRRSWMAHGVGAFSGGELCLYTARCNPPSPPPEQAGVNYLHS